MLFMRSILLGFVTLCVVATMPAPARAEPGTEAERVSRASQVDEDMGAVIISIRSEIYLDEPLDVYFLREGGSLQNDADVVRFSRRQGFFAFGNDTLEFQIRAYELSPGTYRMIAHGMDCAKIPAENERCLIDEPGLLGTIERSRPSRGYPEIAPSFEVVAGAVTNAGDFVLTSRNQVEWAAISFEEISRADRKFKAMARGPEPLIPGEYHLKYGLTPRSWEDDAGRRY